MVWQEENIDGLSIISYAWESQKRAGCLLHLKDGRAEVLNYTKALLSQQHFCYHYKHLKSLG